MPDIFERQRTPSQASGIIKVAGINGSNFAPDISRAIESPQVASLPNVSGQFFERATQSINNAIDTQQDIIAQRARSASQIAQAESQSTNQSTLANVIGGLSAGVELFTQLRQQRREQQNEVDTALFERRVRDQIVDMNSTIATNAHNQGFIPTQQLAFREIDRQFSHLPLPVRQEVFSIAQQALNEAQKQQTTRMINSTSELANTIREQRRQELRLITTAKVESLAFRYEPEVINSTLDSIFDDVDNYLERTSITGIDALNLTSSVYEQVNAALEDSGRHTAQSRARLEQYRQAANQAITITQETQGNPRARELRLAELNARFNNILPGIDFRTLIPTSSDVVTSFLNEQQSIQSLRDFQNRNSFLNTEINEATFFQRGQLIFDIHNNGPLGTRIRTGVQENAITDPEVITAVRQADEFDSDVEAYRQLSESYLQYSIEVEQNLALIQEAADKLDPTGRLGQVTQPNALLTEVIELAGRERGRLSPETFQALVNLHNRRIGTYNNRQVDTRQQIENLLRKWQPYGLRLDGPSDRTLLDELGARARPLIEQAEREFRERRSRIPAGLGGQPNFSVGTMTTTPPIVPLHTDREGLTLPFQSSNAGSVIATSEYGPRTHPVTGRVAFHAGLDIDTTNGDENVRAVAGGEVLHVADWSGFGGTVTVRTDSGHVEQYSHLRNFNVQVGDLIAPGTVVGLMGGGNGDPMAGRSTGRHLHFQVYAPTTNVEQIGRPPYEGTTVDPRDYLTSVQHSTELPLGAGLPANQSHPGSDQLSLGNTWINETYNNYRPSSHIGGASVFSGNLSVAANPSTVYNNSTPQPNRRSSINNDSYPTINDPRSNYGYGALRDNSDLASAIARVSDNLGFPAQWLADVIDYESGFRSNIVNSEGAVGLIQFYPGGGLRQVAQHLGVSESQASDHLRTISAAEQMQFVELYLRPYASRINTVEDLLAAVFGGPSLLNKTPRQRSRISDGFISFGEYVTRLGRRAGRRYQTSYDRLRSSARDIHYKFTPGCARCNQMLAQIGEVLPHEA